MDYYKKIFLEVCQNAVNKQKGDGSMPGGHNGPYYDPHTPVRNTSHWSISFIKAYELTNDIIYRKAAENCLQYLLNCEYRTDYTYIHRNKKGKDTANGTIGPAWNIECYLEAYRHFNNEEYLQEAQRLAHLLPFNKKVGYWERISPEGKNLGIDRTFNHQLWFAASISSLLNYSEDALLKRDLNIFMDKLKRNFKVRNDGSIIHITWLWDVNYKITIKNLLQRILRVFKIVIKNKTMKYKEFGYHLFNMYAFAILYKNYDMSSVFGSNKFMRALKLCFSRDFYLYLELNDSKRDLTKMSQVDIKINRYGYSYNPPGFELPFIYKIFNCGKEFKKDYSIDGELVFDIFKKQIELTYNQEIFMLNRNTEDESTLSARIYELAMAL